MKKEKRIGIPRAMSYYNYFPFWYGFFNKLGFEIIISDPTTKKTVSEKKQDDFDFTQEEDYSFGPFTLVFKKVQILKNGTEVPLSLMECKLLMYLVKNRETLVKTDNLMDVVWGYDETISSGTIYTHISWLRKKLATKENPKGYIKTVRNVGYIFSEK